MTRKDYHHGNLRDALVTAAAARIATEPFDTMSMRALAQDVGVSPGAPYHHFGDRAGLRHALCRHGFDGLHMALLATDTLETRLAAYFDFVAQNRALFDMMFAREATTGAAADLLHPHADPVMQTLFATLQMRWPAFDPGDVTAAWAFLHGMATLLPASPLQAQLGSTDPVTFAIKVINRICTG